jgi:hypothetical protein
VASVRRSDIGLFQCDQPNGVPAIVATRLGDRIKAGVLIPKFAKIGGMRSCELRNQGNAGKFVILVPL